MVKVTELYTLGDEVFKDEGVRANYLDSLALYIIKSITDVKSYWKAHCYKEKQKQYEWAEKLINSKARTYKYQ